EFFQFGTEMFGSDSPAADATVIALAASVLRRLGLKNVKLHINSIGCPNCRPNYRGALVDYYSAHTETMCDTCKDRLAKNPLRLLDCKNPPCAALAKVLCERTGFKKVFFGNSGAEANECAIKVARKWGEENKGVEYSTVITLRNSFHGRTVTTLSATGQDHYHEHFGPMTPGFVHADAEDISSVRRLAEENKACAIMFECVQGEGGVIPLSREFVAGLVEVASEFNLLIIVDEVQTGNGRTGELYGYMNYGITPDIVSTAKGLGGGLPIGAALLGERVENVLRPGDHGSTYGGNPVCSAGALSVINRLDDAFLASVKEKSELIIDTLTGKPGIVSVSGMGLMLGIKTEKPARDVVSACLEAGVLCLTAKDKVRLLPALNIPTDVLREALDVIVKACE
ncbi:MAG: aminotransferase class III-fold pyridoxal phosphate-dependent enzyme, partial [Clostridia bacterium]|nr:aminotransferase class III-fold pyridoxal phosphate-dependent enzyme [Clostridia bacterium]